MSKDLVQPAWKRFTRIYLITAVVVPAATYALLGLIGLLVVLLVMLAVYLLALPRLQMNEAGAKRLIAKYSIAAIVAHAVSAFSLIGLTNNLIDKWQRARVCRAPTSDWICLIPNVPELSKAEEWILFLSVTFAIITLNLIWFATARQRPPLPEMSIKGNVILGGVKDSSVVSINVERDARSGRESHS